MAPRNTAIEQLGYKIQAEKIITVSASCKKLLLGLPNVLKKNNCTPQGPHVLVLFCIPCTPSSPGRAENRDIRDRNTKQLCAVIRQELAKELARAGMGNNAARNRRAIAVLKSALAKQ